MTREREIEREREREGEGEGRKERERERERFVVIPKRLGCMLPRGEDATAGSARAQVRDFLTHSFALKVFRWLDVVHVCKIMAAKSSCGPRGVWGRFLMSKVPVDPSPAPPRSALTPRRLFCAVAYVAAVLVVTKVSSFLFLF